jgi:hypothetical protein
MGSIGDSFGLSVPAVGSAGPTYASTINSILTEAMARLETRVPSGSLAPWSGAVDANNNRLDNASALGLYEQVVSPTGTPYGRLVRYGGNLWYVDSSGPCQITNGPDLNAGSIGGIGGDYGSPDPAQVVFVGGDETYEFYDNFAASEWALVKARGFSVIDEGGSACRILPHATQSAFDLFLPQNDPASGTSVMTLDSAGQMGLAESGSAVTQFSVAAQDLKHTTRVQWYHGGTASLAVDDGADWLVDAGGNTDTEITADLFRYPRAAAKAATESVARVFPMPEVGKRLVSVAVKVVNPAGSTCTVSCYRVTTTTATLMASDNTAGTGTVTVTVALNHTVATDQGLLVRVGWVGGTGNTSALYAVAITYDYV